MYLLIVHIPSAIYVWIGKNCEAIMERDARGAVCQIVRYERVQGPITIIKEGEEPAYSWDAFSNIFPLMDKSGNGGEVGESTVKIHPGERKTDGYNVDFEIFQKAIRGSFVPPFASSENEHETHLPARESSWSMLRPKNNSSASSSSSSSSSSSPLYLSPDSISSESSTSSKYFSESSMDSPSAASCSLPVSSTLSNDSDMSLLSSKSSDQPMSNSPENVVSNCSSQSYSRSTSLPSKKLSPLAERRGSLSLKLPVMSDKMRLMSTSSKFLSTKEDGVRINDSTCSVGHIDDIDKGSVNGACCKFSLFAVRSVLSIPSMATTNSASVSLKLLIDTKSYKVLFAEASKEVVDFRFSFLSLNVATVTRLLSTDGMVGCLGNLYQSAESLSVNSYLPLNLKDTLLKPKTTISAANIFQLPLPTNND
ncbi:unnamed protein product [Prunus armeniaca]|uniref:Gelsolin-like domain-containing protein n=1 Tax=Prunus armeniaca TaxID=36596 RepID=A0A6J5WHJ0_PRUAR|nr:unnamed protein product [Prunus armeniaca]